MDAGPSEPASQGESAWGAASAGLKASAETPAAARKPTRVSWWWPARTNRWTRWHAGMATPERYQLLLHERCLPRQVEPRHVQRVLHGLDLREWTWNRSTVRICGKYRVTLSSASGVRVAEKLGAVSTTTACARKLDGIAADFAGVRHFDFVAVEAEGLHERNRVAIERHVGNTKP